MGKMNRIVKNASWIIGCKIAETIFMLIVTMLQARIFGPQNFGLLSYAQTVVNIVVPVMQLGLNSILVKEIVDNKEKEGEIVGSSLLMSLVASPISILFVIGFVAVYNHGSTETLLVCFLYSLLLLFQVFELLQFWFLANYMSKYPALVVFASYCVTSIYKIVLLIINKNIYYFAISQAIYYFLIAICLLYFYKKNKGQKLSFSLQRCRQLFSKSKFFMISSFAVGIYTQLDRVLLKNICGDEINGYYNAAITIVNMATFIFTAIIDSAQPDLLDKHSKNIEEFDKGMTRLYSIVIYLALLMCLSVNILAKPVIFIMYGAEYAASIPILRVVVFYGLFSFIGIARNVYIVAEGIQKDTWYINVLGTFFSLLTNYFLISRFSAMGAAVAAILVQIFVNVFMGYIIKSLRKNNRLMLQAVNPKHLSDMIKEIL